MELKKELEEKAEKLEKDLAKLRETIDNIDSEIDFNQWIGRNGRILAIKGDKYLKSFSDINIHWNDCSERLYNEPIKYEVVHMSDLNPGDVVIKDNITSPTISDFNIFIGKDNDNNYISNYLETINGIEVIGSHLSTDNKKVKRFLRK